MRTFILSLILLILTSSFSVKRSSFLVYEVSGIMYSHKTKEILSNEEFVVNSDTIYTNDKGEYSHKILYVAGKSKGNLSACQARRMYNLVNPKYIVYQYRTKTIFVKNKWKNFIGKDDKVYNVNLKW